MHRHPGSPPGEPALLEEVLSSLKHHQEWKVEEAPTAMARFCLEDPHPSRGGVPQKRKKDISVERRLATVWEAHQKAPAVVATLKEEIERLSCSWNHLEARARLKSRDCGGGVEKSRRGDTTRSGPKDPHAPNHPTDPKTEPGKEGATSEGSDLEESLELRLEVASFLRGSLETSGDKGDVMPLEPMVLEFSQWVPWKTKKCETPDWWSELLAVPGMEDHRKLAREVRASFHLPQQMHKLAMKEANLQAPPTLPCLGICRFMLPAESIYACRDI